MESGRGVGPGDGVVEFPLAKGLFRTRDGPLGAGALMVVLWISSNGGRCDKSTFPRRCRA